MTNLFNGVTFQFNKITVDKDKKTTQAVVYALVQDERFAVIRLVPSNLLTVMGLEKDQQKLVYLNKVALNIAETLTDLAAIDRLTEASYKSAIDTFEPFMDTYFDYEHIERRIKAIQRMEGWM